MKKEIESNPGNIALIVDDVALNRTVLKLMLERINWKTYEASSGKEALEIIEDNKSFRIIFMDISMPDMDGNETLKKIREKNIFIPVIACTAFALDGDRENFITNGFNGYIPKPVKIEILQKEIEFVLNSPDFLKIDCDHLLNYKKEFIPEVKVLDYDKLVETCYGMEDLAKELLRELINHGALWIKEADDYLQKNDINRIRKISHLVRGTASTIHAEMLFEKARIFGDMARENKIDELPGCYNEFKYALFITLNWCKKKLQEN